jgi:FecR protein
MVQAQKATSIRVFCLAIILLFFSGPIFAQRDPPARVARLNYINGNVSMEPAGVNDWAPADVNRPFTIGDYLYADQGAAAELHLDDAVMRIGSQTSFGFLNLDDRTVQIKMTEGDMYIRVHDFGSDQVFEVDTPNAAVTLLRDGIYRFRVDANGNMSFVVVRQGQAEVTGAGQAFTLNPDSSATLTGTDQLSYAIQVAPQTDEFDQWCEQRDVHEAQLAQARYLPPTVIGNEDLGDYGTWQNSGDYGPVWYPRAVDAGWAPYHYGHWAWIEPWGWTWIDSQPWGFAPFHYGRWVYIRSRWGWCPGPIVVGAPGPVVRPYYAPAMVAWFGGSHWGVGISVGGGPSLGWVPLGWGEVYTPAYHCSPRYFNNVNVYNTRIVRTVNITNVYNTVYVNKTVYRQEFVNARAPNAVMAMPQAAFASGRPVRQAAVPVRAADFARMQTAAVVAPPVTPTRQSVLATSSARPVARPAAPVLQRQVMARAEPPARPAAFVGQQRSSGEPAPVVHAVAPNVRRVTAAAPVAVRPGDSRGSAAASISRSMLAPSRQQPAESGHFTERTGPSIPTGRPAGPAGQPPTVGSAPPPPAAHGVPPNLRRSSQPTESGQVTERNTPSNPASRAPQQPVQERSQPQPPVRSQPQVQERSQPQPPVRSQPQVQERSQPQPPVRSQPQVQERSQPQPPVRSQPQVQERSQPQPPVRSQPQVQERSQPRPESRPEQHAPAPPHQEHPKNDKKQ